MQLWANNLVGQVARDGAYTMPSTDSFFYTKHSIIGDSQADLVGTMRTLLVVTIRQGYS